MRRKDKKGAQFVLDPREYIFCDARSSMVSDAFFIDRGQTDDDRVTFAGNTLDGNVSWRVQIGRGRATRHGDTYVADIVVHESMFADRIVWWAKTK